MEKCSRRGGICEFEISIVFNESLFWKAVSFHLSPASRLIFVVVEDKMEGGIEKDCTALGGLFQTIITDMRVSWTYQAVITQSRCLTR